MCRAAETWRSFADLLYLLFVPQRRGRTGKKLLTIKRIANHKYRKLGRSHFEGRVVQLV
jgi:hypothetical protein